MMVVVILQNVEMGKGELQDGELQDGELADGKPNFTLIDLSKDDYVNLAQAILYTC